MLCICLLVLTGCKEMEGIPHKRETSLLYDGEVFDFHSGSYWTPVDKRTKWEDVCVGFYDTDAENGQVEYTTRAKILKGSSSISVIAYGAVETNYYIKRGQTPSVYVDNVEKIVVSNDFSSISIETNDLTGWLEFLKESHLNKHCEYEKWSEEAPDYSVYVYFTDFPLYYYYGYMGRSESGRWGISTWDYADYNSSCIIIPDELASIMCK